MTTTYENIHYHDYLNARGALPATLKNDLLFHYILQKSKPILKNLVCSLKGLAQEDIKDVIITNPIDYAEYTGKQIILDVRVILNNSEILDLELQMYHDSMWENRSLFYLCRAFDSIGNGDEYGELKPTTLIAIMDEDLFPEHHEFYSHFMILHTEKYYPYSTKLRINVLYLNRTELATETDKANKLDYWAKLFKSETWEELIALAKLDPIGEEVAEVMYEAVIQSQEKTIFEAHQRYLYSLHAAETGGYDKGLEEGIEKGKTDYLVSLICKKLSRGLTIDQIAKELEEDPEHISKIYDIALKYAPDYNPESVLKELNS